MDIAPELVRDARAGDRDAMEALIAGSYRPAYTLALRLLGDPDDAAEATQEAYIRMVRGLKRFREDGAFRTWLFKIVSNVCMTELRRRGGRQVPVELEVVEDTDPTDVSDVATNRVFLDELERSMRELPEAYRSVVVLRDVYDLSGAESAEILGISPGAVKVRLHRARRMLRDDLLARFPDWAADAAERKESA